MMTDLFRFIRALIGRLRSSLRVDSYLEALGSRRRSSREAQHGRVRYGLGDDVFSLWTDSESLVPSRR